MSAPVALLTMYDNSLWSSDPVNGFDLMEKRTATREEPLTESDPMDWHPSDDELALYREPPADLLRALERTVCYHVIVL